jgi:hypothetical protein
MSLHRAYGFALALFMLSGPLPAVAAPGTSSLVGYWKLDETATTSPVLDFSGYGNNGTSQGTAVTENTPTTSFLNPRAREFDGSTSKIPVGTDSSLNISGALTISAWIYPRSFGGGNRGRIFDRDANSKGYEFALDNNTGTNALHIGINSTLTFGTNFTRSNNNVITLNQWQHVTVTWPGNAGGTATFYVNGVASGGGTMSQAITGDATLNGIIGGREADHLRDFDGYLDDVRVYNRVLSTSEISALAAGNHTSAVWTGGNSTDYETASNWNTSAMPDPYTQVTIGTGVYQPIMTAHEQSAGITINSGATLDLAGHNIALTDAGMFANNGTFMLQGGETLTNFSNDTTHGTTTYTGSGTYASLIAGNTYKHLHFNGSGLWTLNAPLTVGGDLTITSGTLSSGGNTISLAGNWSNTGAYTHGNNTVTLSGNDQRISGTTTFYNLVKSVSSAATLTFSSLLTQTIANTLTLQGISGSLLALRSSSPDVQWKFNPQGSGIYSYLDVKDSNNLGSLIETAGLSITNSGNNTNWRFDYTTPSISVIGSNPATLYQGQTYSDAGATALDETDGDLTSSIRTSNAVDTRTSGTYTVTYSVSDTMGNSTVATRTVIVRSTGGGIIVGCTDPKALNYSPYALGENTTLCQYPSASHKFSPAPSLSVVSVFARDLKRGMSDESVKRLQEWLNRHGFTVARNGAGSPGNETNYFGPATQRAVAALQLKNDIAPAIGYFGPITRTFVATFGDSI